MDNFLIFYPIFHPSGVNSFLNVSNNIDSKSLTNKIRSKNNQILFLISALNLDSLYISLTNSNSIFYRFKFIDTNYEFKWEVFIEEEDEESDIESILHLYKNNTKIKSTYGSIDYIYNVINSIVSKNAIYSSKIEAYTPNIYIKTYEEGYLSSALSPY